MPGAERQPINQHQGRAYTVSDVSEEEESLLGQPASRRRSPSVQSGSKRVDGQNPTIEILTASGSHIICQSGELDSMELSLTQTKTSWVSNLMVF